VGGIYLNMDGLESQPTGLGVGPGSDWAPSYHGSLPLTPKPFPLYELYKCCGLYNSTRDNNGRETDRQFRFYFFFGTTKAPTPSST